ncbi:MAG: hypothetical protein H6953_04890 [Chromatiaceae bacterium]|nr:hypothetical protein [Chromatiaceae bacterium]MCP5314487.1 hypothetical protein [Chromatiaceae bacterium]
MRYLELYRQLPNKLALIALLVAAPMGGFAASEPDDGLLTEDARPPGVVQYSKEQAPLYYDPVSLQLGRDLYASLQNARSAARDKQPALLRIALQEAVDDLATLQLPEEQTALLAQLRIIRNDLSDSRKPLDHQLWVPVQVDIDESIKDAPVDVQHQVRAAVQSGKQAATQGDRDRAKAHLDQVTSTLSYSLGVFPLQRMSALLDAALRAAYADPPNWDSVIDLVNHATAAIRWYAHVPVSGLAGAYSDVINAHRLALIGKGSLVQQQIVAYVGRAVTKLSRSPETRPLAQEAAALSRKASSGKPVVDDLQRLLGDLRSQIAFEQTRARDRYWEEVGKGVMP